MSGRSKWQRLEWRLSKAIDDSIGCLPIPLTRIVAGYLKPFYLEPSFVQVLAILKNEGHAPNLVSEYGCLPKPCHDISQCYFCEKNVQQEREQFEAERCAVQKWRRQQKIKAMCTRNPNWCMGKSAQQRHLRRYFY